MVPIESSISQAIQLPLTICFERGSGRRKWMRLNGREGKR